MTSYDEWCLRERGREGRVRKHDARVLKSSTLFLTRKSKGHSLFLSGNSFVIFLHIESERELQILLFLMKEGKEA